MAGPGDNTRGKSKPKPGLLNVIGGLSVSCLLVGCGTAWHPTASGFATIQEGNDLRTDFDALMSNYSGDGTAIAATLTRRGATCKVVPSELRGGKTFFSCTYFFCKGSWLQRFDWGFPPHVPNNSEPGSRDAPYSYFTDLTLSMHGECRDREKLAASQRQSALAHGSDLLVSKALN